MVSDAQKRAVLKYDAEHTRQYHLKLNTGTDADIIEFLSGKNIQGYIKQLIRDDMNRIRCQNGCQIETGVAEVVEK